MSKQLRNYLLILLLLGLLPLLGCVSSTSPGGTSSPPPEWTSSLIEVTDQLGRVVELDRIPQRIISLDPGNTEILFALGLGDKVVAVTDYCDFPDEAKTKPSVVSRDGVDMTKLAELSPDLVLATSLDQVKVIPELERQGLTVFALAPYNLDEVFSAINLTGEITGRQEEASQLLAEMRDRIEAVTDKTNNIPYDERPRVFYVSWHDPLITTGSGTMVDDLIEKAGGINIAHYLTGYSNIDINAVVEANPEVIFVSYDMTLWLSADLPFEFVTTESWELSKTDALLNGRVYQIWNVILERHGPRLVNGLEELSMLMYWEPSE